MNPQRTPPKVISSSGSGSGSVPNLSTYGKDEYNNNVNLRKRKDRSEENDYKEDFEDFRMEMMKFLEDFGRKQNENLKVIQTEISEIKNEIKTIKSATEIFTQRFELINNEIQNIKTNNSTTEDKIKHIECEISQIKNQQHKNSPPAESLSLSYEHLILEMKERCEREHNIVIVGIPEITDQNSIARQKHDNEEVIKITKMLVEDCPIPIKCLRLGKYSPTKNRAIKVQFNNNNTPKQLLQNKSKLPDNMRLFSDQTPSQRKYLLSLRDEMNKRIENGEKDLTIKYVKGVPSITKINKKN
ncbi:hypothetical protein B5X24_HaOG202039 [Helicoverpa armigera]|uniref:Uncharacterized protein n=1 Tax=Helicoverpa armigera TaxID=29058 RepID=A0A2W1C0D6_HELAM|nr:hypothetical protein B5X24_HaOG202039 [Helicoverpa armigera]